eukprot:gene31667-40770_t
MKSALFIKAAIVGFCGCVTVTSALAAWQLNAPLTAPTLFPISETYFIKAKDSASPEEGIKWAVKATQVAPNRAENWVLLAYAHQRQSHAIDTPVIESLRTSYGVAPFSADANQWRITYVFSNWGHMPTDLQSAAFSEAEQYIGRRVGASYIKDHLVKTIQDDEGRLVMSAVILDADQKLNLYNANLEVEGKGDAVTSSG